MNDEIYIAIVDMEQPSRHGVCVLQDENDNVAKFTAVSVIASLKQDHPLGVFSWWAFNVSTGEAVAV